MDFNRILRRFSEISRGRQYRERESVCVLLKKFEKSSKEKKQQIQIKIEHTQQKIHISMISSYAPLSLYKFGQCRFLCECVFVVGVQSKRKIEKSKEIEEERNETK